MITPDRQHPRFNAAKEALCLLAKHPIAVPLALIVDDLGLDNNGCARQLFRALGKYGVKVLVNERGAASVDHESWGRAQAIGENYIDQVGD
jgi:hypothetical protein